ncbi:MAG: coproporphyrinogen III oxidase family protein [Thermodesulfobacteriota bacterium]|nr:coproporphyrinogen III oxidase family protein [Thermodesulfobacteriota bacterium]
MIIEEFIGWFLKYKSKAYLKFEEPDNILLPPNPPLDSIELYVHIPFCKELCPYCSFHRFKFHEETARLYYKALRKELKIYKDMGYKFGGVYIGGGTPTIMMDELVDTLSLIHKLFSPKDISVETNPDHLHKKDIALLVDMGVGRISVGIQSFDDTILRLIDRYDRYGSGFEMKRLVQDVMGDVGTLNLDMIYNFPIQTPAMLEHDLDVIEKIAPDQVTFYPLMVPDATKRRMEKIMGRISYKKEAAFYRMIQDRLADGYTPSSAWCFSKKDLDMIDEYIVNYDQYVGAGSGSFGLVGNTIYSNTFSIKEYAEDLNSGRLPLKSKKIFSIKEMARYHFLMSLFGLEMGRALFKERFGCGLWSALWVECLFFLLIGGIHMDKDIIRVTEKGMYYWVIMMREFFIGVDNFREISRRALLKEDSQFGNTGSFD